ncbi:MAG: serine hydrolase [Chloroflexi bacterium]|nr:serine hydrolase [Chloroflexota bacterium]
MKLIKPEKVGLSATRLARIRPVMQRYIDENKFAGIVTLIARRGQLVHFEAIGLQDRETNQPMQVDSLFRIYSMTKPITTVAAMLLYEEGRFQLSDPVAKFIPAFQETKVWVQQNFAGMELAPQASPMTIRDLMTHTAGLSYGWFNDTPVDALYREAQLLSGKRSLAELVQVLATIPLAHQPGTRWRYSVATDVLGHIIEIIAGMPLDQFFAEKIFQPLGMNDTHFSVPSTEVKRFTTVYTTTESGLTPLDVATTSAFLHKPNNLSGGGGLVSTATDYMRFCQMMLNKGELDGVRLLGRKTVELMVANHLPITLLPIGIGDKLLPGEGFGLGYSILLDPAQNQILGSEGVYAWGGAANTTFWIDPKEELIAILMAQFMPSDTYPLVRDFRVLTYQALVD